MKRVGWVVISPNHGLGLFLEEEPATTQAVKLHGIKKGLVLDDDVLALVQAAFDQGVAQGRLMQKADDDATR